MFAGDEVSVKKAELSLPWLLKLLGNELLLLWLLRLLLGNELLLLRLLRLLLRRPSPGCEDKLELIRSDGDFPRSTLLPKFQWTSSII